LSGSLFVLDFVYFAMHDPCLMRSLFVFRPHHRHRGTGFPSRFVLFLNFWISLLDRSLFLFRFPFLIPRFPDVYWTLAVPLATYTNLLLYSQEKHLLDLRRTTFLSIYDLEDPNVRAQQLARAKLVSLKEIEVATP
jgi:hypothetical protein